MNVPGLLERSTLVLPPPKTGLMVNLSASRVAAAASSTVIPPSPGLAPCPTLSSKASRLT